MFISEFQQLAAAIVGVANCGSFLNLCISYRFGSPPPPLLSPSVWFLLVNGIVRFEVTYMYIEVFSNCLLMNFVPTSVFGCAPKLEINAYVKFELLLICGQRLCQFV